MKAALLQAGGTFSFLYTAIVLLITSVVKLMNWTKSMLESLLKKIPLIKLEIYSPLMFVNSLTALDQW